MEAPDRRPLSFSASASAPESSSALLTEHLSARAVARLFGVKVGTLGKWRYLKKGPQGWLYLSKTCVVYPITEVERFLAERAASKGGDES